MIWQAIEDNKRRSWTLFITMAAVLLAAGYAIGYASLGPRGAGSGLAISGILWIGLSVISYFWGDQILLSAVGAREITPEIHPKLFNVTEEMQIAAGLNRMPKLYVIDEVAPNAFATGIHTENASITVTLGLLTRLNRDELQGVVAHEMSHILNRDVLFVTLAGTMLGSIQLLSDAFLRGIFSSNESSNKRFRSSSGKGGGAMVILALAVAILAPILIQLFYFSLSRKREYLADACGARLTRYPEGLASALEKISKADFPSISPNPVTAAMYIYNPLKNGLAGLMSTHPPAEERIQILRAMTTGAGLAEYQKAFGVIHRNEPLIGAEALKEQGEVSIRPAVQDEKVPGEEWDHRSIGDLTRSIHGFAFFPCQCGLRIKVPPEFEEKKITCPRCGFVIDVPFFGKIGEAKPKANDAQSAQSYTRRGGGWESFFCGCGRVIQIAPNFSAPSMTCSSCGKTVVILSAAKDPV